MKANRTTGSILRKSLFAFVAACLLALPAAWSAEGASEKKLVVNVEDLRGHFDIAIESAREDLLEAAFYDSALRTEWKGNYEFNYNEGTPKDARGHLTFRIVSWRRSPANFYEFTATATYYDLDGKAINLGTFNGTRSGLIVSSRYDVNEMFVKSAEDAFGAALRKLDKVAS